MTDKKDQTLDEIFEDEWEYQKGSLMLKEANQGIEWKHSVARHFFNAAITAAESRQASRDEAVKDLIEIFEECFNSIHAYGITKKSIVISTEIQRAVKALTVYQESLK